MKSASIIHNNAVCTVNDDVGRGEFLNMYHLPLPLVYILVIFECVSFALTFGIQTGDF